MNAKKIAAEKAVDEIKNGMTIGLGTGSTVYWTIQKIGERIKQGLKIKAVATSLRSEKLAAEAGIYISSFSEVECIDVAVDGADEIDTSKNLIKGGGGALLREKIIAYNSKRFIVVADESKLKEKLGQFPLPVEIVPFAFELTLRQLEKSCCKVKLRVSEGKNFITDNGNLIADCSFYPIEDPAALNTMLHLIPGVVETGLFLNSMVHGVIIGFANGDVKIY